MRHYSDPVKELAGRLSVIERDIKRMEGPIPAEMLKFNPSSLRSMGVEQSVHLIFKKEPGKRFQAIKMNAVTSQRFTPTFNIMVRTNAGQTVQDALQNYKDVEKIAVFLKDKEGKELLIYDAHLSVLNNYRDVA